MHRLTRAVTTLIAAGIAGFAIWVAGQMNERNQGGYWATVGLLAGAGLVMALSQLVGGWTKWGRPRVSGSVLLIAFVPVAVVTLWMILAGEPGNEWFHRHVSGWSGDLHVRTFVTDMLVYVPVLAFGTGLVLGFSLETSGPRRVAADTTEAPETRAQPDETPTEATTPTEPDRETTRVS
jgi:hypothetical protein